MTKSTSLDINSQSTQLRGKSMITYQSTRTRWKSFTLIFVLVAQLVLPCLAVDGVLDTSFNAPNGFIVVPNTRFAEVAIQPSDSKILAVGTTTNAQGATLSLIVARFNPDGTLDSSFGTGGIATASATGQTSGINLVLQPDGKIVAGGSRRVVMPDGEIDFFVTRFDANGSIDSSFGQTGWTSVDFFGDDDALRSISIAPGGTIVAAGFAVFPLVNQGRVAIARLDSTGNLDGAFGSGGKVANEVGLGLDAAVLADGRILVAGQVLGAGPGNSDFGLFRYTSSGSLDITFGGGDGIASADFFNGDGASAIALQTDGSAVLAGQAGDLNSNPPIPSKGALARFDSNGLLDASFGNGGMVITDVVAQSSLLFDMALQSDGRIVVVGSARTGSLPGDNHPLVSRFTTNGSPDSSFGAGGHLVATLSFSSPAFGVAIQSDGKIVIVGEHFTSPSWSGWVARYLASGATPPPPDPSFDICLQSDNSNAGWLIFKFNSTTGAYEFRDCSKGVVLTGTGTLSSLGCKLYLNDTGPNKSSDRSVSITVNTCTNTATVSVTIKSLNKTYGFTDNDITQGSCSCL
jgi:uncharacterized delta-60 repeat protein